MSRYEHQQYISEPKEKRRELACANGLAERKRFLLSSHPELKKRLALLQKVVRDFQKQYPEFISLGLYGSLIKGYATPESDIDADIFIDQEIAEQRETEPRYRPFRLDEFRERLRQELSLSEEKTRDVYVREISKKEILENLRHSPPVLFMWTHIFLL